MKVLGVDLQKLHALLGSGEERFCAKVLKTVPAAAEKHGLVKEWKRAVTSLVLGDAGETLAARDPWSWDTVTRADPALSLAFASILEGFAEEGLGGTLDEDLIRPSALFGLEADGTLVRWGRLGHDPLPIHPLMAPIVIRKLDVIVLWTD